eukprot:scaffold26407_cov114-Isochrysis_galbana.AAC.4
MNPDPAKGYIYNPRAAGPSRHITRLVPAPFRLWLLSICHWSRNPASTRRPATPTHQLPPLPPLLWPQLRAEQPGRTGHMRWRHSIRRHIPLLNVRHGAARRLARLPPRSVDPSVWPAVCQPVRVDEHGGEEGQRAGLDPERVAATQRCLQTRPLPSARADAQPEQALPGRAAARVHAARARGAPKPILGHHTLHLPPDGHLLLPARHVWSAGWRLDQKQRSLCARPARVAQQRPFRLAIPARARAEDCDGEYAAEVH